MSGDASSIQLENPSQNLLKDPKAANTNPEAGMLSASEYKNRRSETLLHNPEARLDEMQEIRGYFDRQPSQYVETINGLAKLDKPMGSNCRIVVTIPSFNEGTRVRHALEQYVSQDIPTDQYEIVLFNTPAEGDDTPKQVEEFQREHPDISVIFVEKPWDEGEPATVGNARKYAADIAMARILKRVSSGKETMMVINDADTDAIESNYLSSLLAELDAHPDQDLLTTPIDLPVYAMRKPNIAAAYRLQTTIEDVYATGNVGSEHIPEPATTHGRSIAMRTSVYAAVGGVNPKAIIAEDWELGWLVADARDWDPNRVSLFKGTRLVTDPRRFIDCVANRVPVDQQLLDFETKPELRQLDNEKVLETITDSLDWELFQDDADSEWAAGTTGSNRRISKRRYSLIFRTAMDRLGVDYEINDKNWVILKNVDGLAKQLGGPDHPVSVIHSQSRVYTPEMVAQLSNFFNTTGGVIEARRAKASKIAQQIEDARNNGQQEISPELLSQYERFAGQEYQHDRSRQEIAA